MSSNSAKDEVARILRRSADEEQTKKTLDATSLSSLSSRSRALAAAEYVPNRETYIIHDVFPGFDGYLVNGEAVSKEDYWLNDEACREAFAASQVPSASRASSAIVKASKATVSAGSRKRPGPPLASSSAKVGGQPPSFRASAASAPSKKPITLKRSGGSGTTDDPFLLVSDEESHSEDVVEEILSDYELLRARILVST